MPDSLVADTAVPALLIKLGRYPLHHGAFSALRSLGRLGVPVFAITEDRFTRAASSRYLRSAFTWTTTGLEEPDVLVEGLLRIGRQIRNRAVLIPTDDEAAILLQEHASALALHFLYPSLGDPDLARRLVDKSALCQLCHEHG